ncbi:Uncharacterised protein [Schaalia odontolytica]|uniref:Uncharacterized protein n=1 Tax=Schaalia odontolytica TaxID=1660 RepID=A0A2X0UHY9_9ACTO|nr:Uncharacterised protein [Schaalia odontolytica]
MTALASGSSSAVALLKPVNPSIATISMRLRQVWGWEASQVLKTRLERPGTMSRSREGPLRSWMGVKSKMTVTYLSPYGVWRHTCSSTPMTRTPSHRAGSLISRRAPSARTAVLAALPGHTEGMGDACHRQMMNDQPSERPAHRRPRELGARIGRLAHILAPHMGALLAPVAAHAHRHDRGALPVWLVSGAPDHRVTHLALASAASTPTDPHQQSGTPTPHGLPQRADPSPPAPGYPGA